MALKLLILVGWFCLSWTSSASKIVLLTSLDPEDNRPPLRLRSWNINEKLEKRFHKEMWKLPYDITPEIIHFSTAKDLYKNLKDPEVAAIIWVGHAGFADNNAGLGSLRSIIDYKGRDLKAIFQAVTPNLKYLALVGCRGQLFLNEWKEKGYLDHTPQLKTFGREVRTDARKGLKLAMENFRELLIKEGNFLAKQSVEDSDANDQGQAYQIPREQYFKATIKRENLDKQKFESIQILQKDRLIGFLPEQVQEEGPQEIKVLIKKSPKTSDLKIVVDSGYAANSAHIHLGLIQIESEEAYEWNIFKTRDGKTIGVGKHIYRPIKTMP